MGLLGSETFDSFRDLLEHHLQDLYDAEARVIKLCPDFQAKADDPQLKSQFEAMERQAKVRRERLEDVLKQAGFEQQRETCEAMKGLIKEASEMADATGDAAVIDAALIQSANRLLHYFIAGYGAARCQLQAAGHEDLGKLLDTSLEDARQNDESFANLAVDVINKKAAMATA